MRLVGVKEVNGTSKENRPYKGFHLYFIYEDDKTLGYACKDCYFSADKVEKLDFEDLIHNKTDCSVGYNQWGKPDFLYLNK